MIVRKPYGISPTFELAIDGVGVDYHSINVLNIDLEESKHDVLKIQMSGIPSRAIIDYYNAPVSLTLKYGLYYTHTFNGYVIDVRPHSITAGGLVNDSPFQEATLVCMGASYSMRGSRSKYWGSYTLTDIAKELSEKYGFSIDVPKTPLVHETVAQTNESDWKFLVRYSEILGYKVNVHATRMHIYDPYYAAARVSSFHKLTTLKKSGTGVTDVPGQILEFNGSFSRRNSDGRYSSTSVSVIDHDNRLLHVTTRDTLGLNKEAEFPNRQQHVAHNYEEAARYIDSNRKQFYDYTADVRVSGIAGCLPGGIVEVDNYGAQFDGLWYVRSVKHTLHSDGFFTDLRLAKNSTSTIEVFTYPVLDDAPESRYTSDRWESSRRVVNEYA